MTWIDWNVLQKKLMQFWEQYECSLSQNEEL